MPKWLLSAFLCACILGPAPLLGDTEDDRKDRRSSRPAVVLNLSGDITDEEVPKVRDALMAIEGVSRVHVCAHTSTITIQFEPDRSRCARRLIETVQHAGFHATLRDRGGLPSVRDTHRTSLSPAARGTDARPAVISARRRY